MRLFAVLCLFLLNISPNLANPLQESTTNFDAKGANQKFDHINLQLSVQNVSMDNLTKAINTVSKLIIKADQCVEDAQKKLSGIDVLIQQSSQTSETNKTDADRVYLSNEQKKISSQQAQCRLFSIRAKEAISAYQSAIAQLKQTETLTRGLPLWAIIHHLTEAMPSDKTDELSTQAISIPPPLNSPLIWALLVGLSLLFATLLLVKLDKSRLAHHYLRIRKLRISHIILLTTYFASGAICIYLFGLFLQNLEPATLFFHLSQLVFFYLSAVVITIFLFKIKKICLFFYWNSLDINFFRALLIFLISFYTISLVGNNLISALMNNELLLQLAQSIFLLAIVSTAIYFIYYFCRAHKQLTFIKHHHLLITRVCSPLLIACAVINILGYQTLSLHLTFSGITTFAIIFITVMVIHGISKLYLTLSQNPTLNHKIKMYFGYKHDQVFTEFLILKITAQIITLAFSLYWIGETWGFAAYYIETVYMQFLYGIHFANFTFYPTRIVAGVIIYCILYLSFRSLSTAISRHQQFEDEEETQVAVASILTYLGFGFAMITSLLVAGFDFTGLAIVAGALSVGIGLGLQSIVNNFVSGLILLIEKPIKPGDRINVDGVEGTVKKIRVRSTQIVTPAHEDIIIPNSDLITRQVTNYMYTDKQLSIHCEVGVAYGTDTLLVKKLLLKIANDHEEVVKTTRNKPTVLFRAFGESNMIFQIYCLIKDANKKSVVQSDIHFSIEKLFRENNIYMAFPQQDIHLQLADVGALLGSLPKKRD